VPKDLVGNQQQWQQVNTLRGFVSPGSSESFRAFARDASRAYGETSKEPLKGLNPG
jgi:hypothetical protein